jgi:hypothetical protein
MIKKHIRYKNDLEDCDLKYNRLLFYAQIICLLSLSLFLLGEPTFNPLPDGPRSNQT